MIKNNRVFWCIAILLAIMAAVACAVNPVSGKKELMFFSEKAEIAMGQDTDRQIKQQFGIYQDKDLNAYVNSVGQKMVPYSHRPKLQYHFAVLDTPVVNAFAAPGGYIYVTRGIMALMGSEAELAAVLGHEMGHVTARHSMKRLSGQMLATIGLVLGSVLSKDIAKVAGLASIGMQLLFLKFSRSDEYQADSLGIRYARQAAYSPAEMLRFFSALENMSVETGGHKIPSFLSTHPMTSDRIAKVKAMVSSRDVRLAVKKEPYLREVDGMVYGDNPRQGFAENGVFYHPEMTFKFTIPSGWVVNNTPMQVIVGEKDGKAALILQAETSTRDLDEYLQAKAKEFGQAELIKSDPVNRFISRHAFFRVPQEQGEPAGGPFDLHPQGQPDLHFHRPVHLWKCRYLSAAAGSGYPFFSAAARPTLFEPPPAAPFPASPRRPPDPAEPDEQCRRGPQVVETAGGIQRSGIAGRSRIRTVDQTGQIMPFASKAEGQ